MITKDDIIFPLDDSLHQTGIYNSSVMYDNEIRKKLASKVADELEEMYDLFCKGSDESDGYHEFMQRYRYLIVTLRAKEEKKQ